MKMKVTVFAITKYHVPKLMKFVISQGVSPTSIKKLSNSFSFHADGDKAAALLIEMKDKFPIAYNQGWSENES